MALANFACEQCGSEGRTLHVHHRLYRRNAEPWEYENHELQCLCEECHLSQHEWLEEVKAIIADAHIESFRAMLLGYEGHIVKEVSEEYGDKRVGEQNMRNYTAGRIARLLEDLPNDVVEMLSDLLNNPADAETFIRDEHRKMRSQ